MSSWKRGPIVLYHIHTHRFIHVHAYLPILPAGQSRGQKFNVWRFGLLNTWSIPSFASELKCRRRCAWCPSSCIQLSNNTILWNILRGPKRSALPLNSCQEQSLKATDQRTTYTRTTSRCTCLTTSFYHIHVHVHVHVIWLCTQTYWYMWKCHNNKNFHKKIFMNTRLITKFTPN